AVSSAFTRLLLYGATSRRPTMLTAGREEHRVLIGPTRARITRALVGFGIVVAVAACGSAATKPRPVPDAPLAQELTTAVSTAAAMTHLQALQKIADENGGNRAAGTRGYEASVEYVAGVLRSAGFEATTPTYTAEDEDGASATGRNVVAQTRTGDPGRTVVIGAHLDSV